MSPSKMRKTQWFREGQEARAEGQPKDSCPYAADPVWYDRPRAWMLGWDEGEEPGATAPPTVEDILARMPTAEALKSERERTGEGLATIKARRLHEALTEAVEAVETVEDAKAVLRAMLPAIRFN